MERGGVGDGRRADEQHKGYGGQALQDDLCSLLPPVRRCETRRPAVVLDYPGVVRVGDWASRAGEVAPRRRIHSERGGLVVIRALIGLLIVIAVVLFLAKVAVAGGIIGAIALILLVLVLLRVL
jgi:hypothetical protein